MRRVEQYNKEMRDLWASTINRSEWPTGFERLWPMQHADMHEGRVVFIGMNPSHNADDSADTDFLRIADSNELRDTGRVDQVVARDVRVMGLGTSAQHRYFAKFGELVGHEPWHHVDLYAVRHTEQDTLVEAINRSSCPFFDAQADAAERLVTDLHPRLVIVANARASHILRMRLKSRLEWTPEEGIHLCSQAGSSVPWMFTGMLTGQRALDTHSFERLQWHVARTMKRYPGS